MKNGECRKCRISKTIEIKKELKLGTTSMAFSDRYPNLLIPLLDILQYISEVFCMSTPKHTRIVQRSMFVIAKTLKQPKYPLLE